MKFLTLVLIVSATMLLLNNCDSINPKLEPELLLKLEDVSCTEAWLQLTTTNIQIPNNISLLINGSVTKTFNLNTQDSLLYIDSLLPNQSYKLKIVINTTNNPQPTTNEVLAQTMDTTSHNFTFETFTFGQHSSSVLYDVAIINENDIWAVGEIYMNDSLGNPDPRLFNLIKWDGVIWKPERVYFKNSQGQSFLAPMKSIFAFSPNDVWIGLDQIIHWNGTQYISIELSDAVFQSWINKIWGSSSDDLYIVGNNGNIAHYQNGSWTKIESGTDVNLKDIYGTPDGSTVWVSGYEDFKPTVLLKIFNSKIETIFNSRDYLFVFYPDHISGEITSVWTNSSNFIYLATPFSLYRKSIYSDPSIEKALRFGDPLKWLGLRTRGTSLNNIFIVGNRGNVHHYNGVTFSTYEELSDNNVFYYSLDVKTNLSVLCGQKYENGISDNVIITLIK